MYLDVLTLPEQTCSWRPRNALGGGKWRRRGGWAYSEANTDFQLEFIRIAEETRRQDERESRMCVCVCVCEGG